MTFTRQSTVMNTLLWVSGEVAELEKAGECGRVMGSSSREELLVDEDTISSILFQLITFNIYNIFKILCY